MDTIKINSILIRMIAVLLMLVLLSTAMVSGRFARYTSSAEGSDSARVAMMEAGVNFTDITVEGYPGASTNLVPITVTNYNGNKVCEVTLKYTVTAENITKNIPLEFAFYEDENGTNPLNEVTFPAGKKGLKTFYLKITWPKAVNSSTYAFEIDAIRIIATATQQN